MGGVVREIRGGWKQQGPCHEESGRWGGRAKICPQSHREMVPDSKQICTSRLAHRREPQLHRGERTVGGGCNPGASLESTARNPRVSW